jgi:transcription initiation factor TFIID subunit 7
MENAQSGPGPSTARIKFTLPAGPRPLPTTGDNTAGNAGQASFGDSGVGNVYNAGTSPRKPVRRRQRGTGASRGGATRGARHNPPRHSSVRASSRISLLSDADHGDPNNSRRLTLSFNKNGAARQETEAGRKTSFLGEYDRDLDENPTEPLAFEEQFILRVPESMAGSLREMVKGKNKGLESVEFKFLGMTVLVWKNANVQTRAEQLLNSKERHMAPSWSTCPTSSRAKRHSTLATFSKSPIFLK